MRKLLYISVFLFACKPPAKQDPDPINDGDSIVIMAKIPKNADLSKIDLSKVVISSQPISLYTKDIEALKKQNVAQDSIILILRNGLSSISALHKTDSLTIASHSVTIAALKKQSDLYSLSITSIKLQSDSVKSKIDTAALFVNSTDFDISNKTLSLKRRAGTDTLKTGNKP